MTNKKFLRIGEVAEKIGRSVLTIKIWYRWHDTQDEETRAKFVLPEIHLLDNKGTRFFAEDEIHLFEKFRDLVKYGMLTDVTRNCWGKRSPIKE